MIPFARITSIRFTTSSRSTGQLATAAFWSPKHRANSIMCFWTDP